MIFTLNLAFLIGALAPDLELSRTISIPKSHLEVQVYKQFMGPEHLPVEFGERRIWIKRGTYHGVKDPVVLTQSKLADNPTGKIFQERIASSLAIESIQKNSAYRDLTRIAKVPSKVYFFGEGTDHYIDATLCWKFTLESVSTDKPLRALTFFVNIENGLLVSQRNEIIDSVTIEGNVHGYVTPTVVANEVGLHHWPILSTIAPTLVDLSHTQISLLDPLNEILSSSSTTTQGHFLLSTSSTLASPFHLRVQLDNAWTHSFSSNGNAILGFDHYLENIGVNNDVILNPSPSDSSVAMLNAYLHANRTHDYVRTWAPEFTALDTNQIALNTDIPYECNAYYYSRSLNFFEASPWNSSHQCPNTAYSTVVSHEYGHYVVEALGLAQGSFGEGFSDTLSAFVNSTSKIGERFFGEETLRDLATTTATYPCGSIPIHNCGLVLGGIWWRIAQFFGAVDHHYISDEARQIFSDWMQVTQGGQLMNSAHPATAVEVLTLDDDDADIRNGTPHYEGICQAFEAHGIRCPQRQYFEIYVVQGRDGLLSPSGHGSFKIQIIPRLSEDVESATVHMINSDGEQRFALSRGQTVATQDIWTAEIPSRPCTESFKYYFSVEDVHGHAQTLPENGDLYPAQGYWGSSIETLYDFSFAEPIDMGWTVENVNGGAGNLFPAGDGTWAYMYGPSDDPDFYRFPRQGWNRVMWENVRSDSDAKLWIAGREGLIVGETRLKSPAFKMPSRGILFSYLRRVRSGSENNEFSVEMSMDRGNHWNELEKLHNDFSGWLDKAFMMSNERAGPESYFQFRFVTRGGESLFTPIQTLLDKVKIQHIACETSTHSIRREAPQLHHPSYRCPADFNHDGVVNPEDATLFMQAYMAGDLGADFDHDGSVNGIDLISFYQSFMQPCD